VGGGKEVSSQALRDGTAPDGGTAGRLDDCAARYCRWVNLMLLCGLMFLVQVPISPNHATILLSPFTTAIPALAPLPNRKPTISRALPLYPRQNTTTTAASSSSTASHIPIAHAGGVLNPSAAAEVDPRDDTATRAFSSAAMKSALYLEITSSEIPEICSLTRLSPPHIM